MRISEKRKRALKRPLRWIGLDVAIKRPYPMDFLQSYGIRTVLDVGAHDGGFVDEIRMTLPNATIHAFEPLPDLFERLQHNTKLDTRVQVWNIALGDQNTTRSIQVCSKRAATSFLPSHSVERYFPRATFEQEVSVEVQRLDSWAERQRLEGPVLLKADVQGFEDCVLRGGVETLWQVEVMLLEVSFLRLYDGQPLFDDIYQLAKELGFNIQGMLGPVCDPTTSRQLQSNAVFVKRTQAT